MRSINKISKSQSEKKAPPVGKRSHKKAVSAVRNKPTKKEAAASGETQRRKDKAFKKPVLPAAVKKRSDKGKQADSRAKQAKKKAAPQAGEKASRKLKLPAALKKRSKGQKQVAEKQAGKKIAPAAKEKAKKKPAILASVKKQVEKEKPGRAVNKQQKKRVAPAIEEKTSKKQAGGGRQAGDGERRPKKQSPAVKEKPFEEKDAAVAVKEHSEKKTVPSPVSASQARRIFPGDLGKRYKCYKCGVKFYDLGRPQPLCPSCGADQQDEVVKVSRKRKGRRRSVLAAAAEPLAIAPEENEDLIEVVDDLDAEYTLDMDDIVLEEQEDAEL